ncbi:MAG: EscU/YscU/HrcU family type III secretion system export apparatus switch protein [Thiothrix sp.]|nr:EscU/YscU/HrcU family type III secretion system export apparatus switch protein [Thiothrix sp.]HPQ93984.1 EscU/YscU/HrcU family type III secretion system export apparatus switch protein [Thiolinea sp.]
MSQDSSSEKTEEATPKKLRDARKKGQVASSKDVPSAFILAVGVVYFAVLGPWFLQKLLEIFLLAAQLYSFDFGEALSGIIRITLELAVMTLLLPFILITTLAAILSFIVQFGLVFSFDPVIPRMEKINPASGFKRIFSAKQLVTTLLSLVKTILIATVLFFVVRNGVYELMNEVNQCNILCLGQLSAELFGNMMMFILPLIITLAIIDYLFQRSQFMKEQRMTKEEVKREMKEMFGDPHVRGARNEMRRELSEQDIQSRIKTARLLLIDIGIAVALHYEQDVTPLPIIVAIGKSTMARKMVEIAQVERVPVLTDGRLVQDLLEEGKLDQYIPTSTIDRVAYAMRKTSK